MELKTIVLNTLEEGSASLRAILAVPPGTIRLHPSIG